MLLLFLLSFSTIICAQDVERVPSLQELCAKVIASRRVDYAHFPPVIKTLQLDPAQAEVEGRRILDIKKTSCDGIENVDAFNEIFYEGGPWSNGSGPLYLRCLYCLVRDQKPLRSCGVLPGLLISLPFFISTCVYSNVTFAVAGTSAMVCVAGCPFMGFMFCYNPCLNYVSNPDNWRTPSQEMPRAITMQEDEREQTLAFNDQPIEVWPLLMYEDDDY